MKPFVVKTLLLLFIVGAYVSTARPSGSWVGNSPVQVASNMSAIYKPTYASSMPEEKAPKNWNSMLLPEGESRVSIFTEHRKHSGSMTRHLTGLSVAWDYAFTENLTTFSLLDWGYSLKSGNGLGSEWAIIGGIGDGFGYGSVNGVTAGPGVKIAYSYSEPNWRITAGSKLSGTYLFSENTLASSKWRTDLNYMRWFGESVGAGVGTAYTVTRCLDHYCYLPGLGERRQYGGFESPTLLAAVKITDQSEVSFRYRSDKQTMDGMEELGLGYSFKW